MGCITATLGAIVQSAQTLEELKKDDVRFGDSVIVATLNSAYTIGVLEDGLYSVRGGWFDRQGVSPRWVTINGCTWGGSSIKQDLVAARGLRLEFGNRVLTSRIVRISVIRKQAASLSN